MSLEIAPDDLSAAVAVLMGPQGPLARHDPAYRERHEQAAMAQAVARAIEGPHALVVEAGTGVGKTYAYLIPLLLSGRRGLVSTATKSLQDQLFWRDLPQLCERLGVPVTTALLKGRSSYLCRHRLTQARHAPEGLDRLSLRLLARVEDWARSTASGDLSEVSGLDERTALLPLVTSTRENCLGSECPAFNDCHVLQARRQAMTADLVVVNHHLFFADLSLKEGGMAELLPAVEVVVFDEAHQILDTGLQFMATSLGTLAVLDLARDLRAGGLAHARGLQDWLACAQGLEQAVRELLLACDGHPAEEQEDHVPGASARRSAPGRGARRIRWAERCSGRPEAGARPVEVAFAQALAGLDTALTTAQGCAAEVADAHPDLQRLAERCQELHALVGVFQSPLAVDRVRWIDLGPHQARLIDTPLDIRDLIQQSLEQTHRAWIFTSATLGDEPELTWFRTQAGLEEAQVLSVGSPFDYAAHARLWVPSQLPAPGENGHNEAVAELGARCAARLGGRTFVLSTTLRALPVIGEHIRQMFESRGLSIEVLVQGSEPKRALLERFLQAAQGGGAVLVGAASFWEGIDVPGQALQCVVIDKLPFPPPDDPLLEARTRALKAQGRDPFTELFLSGAAISLKQGVGRLIRSETDRGLLIICDKRLHTKSYGNRILSALPPMTRLTDGAAVAHWLDQLQASGA
jgi:ATP-dependent DNA helicase DinG